jgi:hypothetical protein
MILSSHQQTVLDALLGWLDRGPPVALLEGFPGTGKTSHIAVPLYEKVNEAAHKQGSRQCLWVRLIEGSIEAVAEKLLIDLAAGLEELGLSQPATELQQGTLTPGSLPSISLSGRLLT